MIVVSHQEDHGYYIKNFQVFNFNWFFKFIHIDFVFLLSGLSLFHSSIKSEQKTFLKLFDRDGID